MATGGRHLPGVQVTGSPAAQLLAASQEIDQKVTKVVRDTGALLLTTIRKNASTGYHRKRIRKYSGHITGTGPGPNVITGDYRRSWRMQLGRKPSRNGLASTYVLVSTNAPQAWRLEKGFVGQDARGRMFNQPPYPHVSPALDKVQPLFEAGMAAVAVDAAAGKSSRVAASGRISGLLGGTGG